MGFADWLLKRRENYGAIRATKDIDARLGAEAEIAIYEKGYTVLKWLSDGRAIFILRTDRPLVARVKRMPSSVRKVPDLLIEAVFDPIGEP
jgi:hypothetical protein